MTTWAHSPVYGRSVLLGPAQADVYRFVMAQTSDDRRPSFPLRAIAEATGRPVSSVHAAICRLRALGIIGAVARMGRTGGFRLWRIRTILDRTLDLARHARAIARIYRRWYAAGNASNVPTMEAAPMPLWSNVPLTAGTREGDAPYGTTAGERVGAGKGPQVERNRPSSPFREAMRRAGFTPWWRDREPCR